MNISCLLSPPSFHSRFSQAARGGVVHRVWIVAAMCMVMLMAAAAKAQTAHFAGAVQTLSGGFNSPQGVAVDVNGNVFVADGNAVKEIVAVDGSIPASPTIRTLASGFTGATGVAVDASGNVFVADYIIQMVKEIVAVNGSIPASPTIRTLGSGFGGPTGVAVDASGNVFVADYLSSQVKEIVAVSGSIPASPTIRTLGSGFSYPTYIDVDGNGNVFVADTNNSQVKEIVAVGGSIPASPTITTLASGLNAYGIAVAPSGDVIVSDQANRVVKKIVAVNGSIPASPAIVTLPGSYFYPYDVASDKSGNIYVTAASSVYEIVLGAVSFGSVAVATTTPPMQTLSFTFDGAGTIAAPAVLTLGTPGLDFKDAGTGTCTTNGTTHAYAAGDTCTVDVTFSPQYPGARQGAVELVNSHGAVIVTAYVTGIGVGPQAMFLPGTTSNLNTSSTHLNNPFQTAQDGAGNTYISNHATMEVLKVPAGGGVGTTLTLPASTGHLLGLTLDGAGNVFAVDQDNDRIVVVPASGAPGALTISGGVTLHTPKALAMDSNGNLYISDLSQIVKVQLDTASLGTGSPMGTGAVIPTPGYDFTGSVFISVTVDAAGTVYASDLWNKQVVKILSSGTTSIVSTGSITLNEPQGLVTDAAGSLYIADANTRIIEVTAAGTTSFPIPVLSTSPSGLMIDPRGYGLIADFDNNRVLQIDMTAAGNALTFANTTVGSNSGAQTVTLLNIGNADLSFPIPSVGNNPSISTYFSLNSAGATACPLITSSMSTAGTVASGTTCTLPISFTPTSAGTVSGSLVLTDNSLNATPSTTQSIPLNGTGLAPLTATVSITSASVTVNHAVTPFTPVTGSGGTAPYTYSISPTLPAGVAINSSTGSINGVPTVASVATTYTVTVTDSTSATATATFVLTVNGPLTATTQISNEVLPVAQAASFTPVTSAGGTTPLTYSIAPALPTGLTLSASTGLISGTPTTTLAQTSYTVTVTDSNGATATASFMLTVNTPPTISFAVPNHIYGDAPFTVSATSNSSGTLTYSVVSGPATISGSTVTITGAGTVILQADQAAAGIYAAASKTASFTVAQGTPTLAFAVIGSHTYGDAPFTVSATSTSTGAVTYAVTSGPATINGNTVTITGVGTVSLSASQAADSNYIAATATTSFTVAPETPTLAFAEIGSHTYGDAPFAVSASSASTGAITYSVTGPATISGSVVTITGAGAITVQASQAAAGNYAASTATVTVTVNKAIPHITFSNTGSLTYQGSPIVLTASSPSTGTLTLAVTSGPATISGNTITITGAGTVNLSVNQVGDANYQGYVGSMALFVFQGTPTLTFAPIGNHVYGDAPFGVSATSASTGAVTYSVVSGPATIAGNVVTITGVGAVTLSASQAADSNYLATMATTSFVVSSLTLNITANNATRVYGAANPAFSGTVTGAKPGDNFTESFTTMATAASAVGSYAIVPSVAGATLASYTLKTTNGTLTITQAPTTTLVALSSSSANPNQSVTLTANVASTTSGTPSGTVTFLDNGVAVKTATLTGGVATSTAIFASGSHTITAAYSGDTNFLASVSAGSGAGVNVPQLDFTLTGPATATLTTGAQVILAYTVMPTYGTYPGPVSFTVSGLPANASYQMSQTAIAASAGPQTVSMTLTGPSVISQTARTSRVSWSLALFLVPLLGVRRMRHSTRGAGRALLMFAILLATAAGMSGLMGCGAGYTGLATKNYTVTVTATSGSVQHSATLTLTVNRAQ